MSSRASAISSATAAAVLAVSGAVSFAQPVGVDAQPAGVDAPRGGIWKAVVPKTAMKGAFDNLDPIGLAAGARIKADCSINWVSPDDGTRYCFSSGTSLEFFMDGPRVSIERARAGWRKLQRQSPAK
jgi:hypothetical protein